MEKRFTKVVKDGNIYIVHLDLTTLILLWKNMEYPGDIKQFIDNLRSRSSFPSLAEVMGINFDDRVTRSYLATAIKELTIEENIGKEVYRGLISEAIPVYNVKVEFDPIFPTEKMVIGNMMSSSTGNKPTVSDAKCNKELSIIVECHDEDNISGITDPLDPPKKEEVTSKQVAKETGKQRVSNQAETNRPIAKGPSTTDKDVAPNMTLPNVGLVAVIKYRSRYHLLRLEESSSKSKYKMRPKYLFISVPH